MVYINYGCGFDAGDGWLNFDASPTLRFERLPVLGRLYTKNGQRFPAAAQYGNIVAGPLCATDSADGVYASHVLEHLALDDCRLALKHTHTMLKAGGTFRLVVPDLEIRARHYVAQRDAGDTRAGPWFMEDTLLGQSSRPKGVMGRLAALMGHQAHLWMWDEAAMTAELAAIGFRDIRRCRFGDSDDPMFAKVEAKVRFETDLGPELALECKK